MLNKKTSDPAAGLASLREETTHRDLGQVSDWHAAKQALRLMLEKLALTRRQRETGGQAPINRMNVPQQTIQLKGPAHENNSTKHQHPEHGWRTLAYFIQRCDSYEQWRDHCIHCGRAPQHGQRASIDAGCNSEGNRGVDRRGAGSVSGARRLSKLTVIVAPDSSGSGVTFAFGSCISCLLGGFFGGQFRPYSSPVVWAHFTARYFFPCCRLDCSHMSYGYWLFARNHF